MRTIAHLSDLHFGREVPAVVEALLADLQARRPDLTVVSGDLTQRARRGQFARAAAFLKRLPGPVLVIPGNHDVPLYDLVRRFFYPLERYRAFISDNLDPFWADDEIAVAGINTARSWTWRLGGFWKDGRIAPEQLVAVARRLGPLPETVFRIVATHHPFIPPPGERLHGMVGGAQPALDELERCGVDVLLAGHLHLGYSGDVRLHYEAARRSMLSVQAGTGVSDRRREEPNAYNLIVVDRPEVAIHVRAWNTREFAEVTVTRYRKADGTWEKVE